MEGELHVIVFDPTCPKHIEDQALGRAGRFGKPGVTYRLGSNAQIEAILKSEQQGHRMNQAQSILEAKFQRELAHALPAVLYTEAFAGLSEQLNEFKSSLPCTAQNDDLWLTFFDDVQQRR